MPRAGQPQQPVATTCGFVDRLHGPGLYRTDSQDETRVMAGLKCESSG